MEFVMEHTREMKRKLNLEIAAIKRQSRRTGSTPPSHVKERYLEIEKELKKIEKETSKKDVDR